MNRELNAWLSERVNFTGLLACALRHPDNSVASHANSDELASASLDKTWNGVYEIVQTLQKAGVSCKEFDCTFTNFHIQGACRPDGSLLALITSDQTEPVDTATMRGLVQEFLTLT